MVGLFFFFLAKSYSLRYNKPERVKSKGRTVMTVFSITFQQLLVFLLIMAIGFTIKKLNILADSAETVLSRLLAYIFGTALTVKTFSSQFRPENLQENGTYLLFGIAALAITSAFGFGLGRFFSKDWYLKRVYTYSLVIANMGYMGYPLVKAIFGEKSLMHMMVFCLPFSMFIYTAGLVLLNPKSQKSPWKSLLNPMVCGMVLGSVLGLLEIPLPSVIPNTLEMLSNCMAPVAMLITGIVIAKFPFKDLCRNPAVYAASLLRLLVIPAVIALVFRAWNVPQEVITIALCATAMPAGLNTVVFPAAYGGDVRPGAGMALISSALGLVTIPLIFSLFITL